MNAAAKKRLMHTNATAPRPDTLVYGLGNTGLSVARYLSRRGVEAVYVDSRDRPPGLEDLHGIVPHAEVVVGDTSAALLRDISRMIVSPGIADNDEFLTEARRADIDIQSDIEIFVKDVEREFVAITGSNGKSTVTTLLALMCDAAGKRALAGGNLGPPALDLLAGETPDLYVLELSSFQLQRTRHLPAKVAVLLNVSPDHLDWHADEAEYRAAKYRIFDQADAAVINRDDPEALGRLSADLPRVSFGLDEPGPGQYGVVTDDRGDYLARGDRPLLACRDIGLVGLHNRANALAAMAAGELVGLDTAAMLAVVGEFRGLPHRMQFVRSIGGVDYINDSKATNVGAAVASVRSVGGPVVLLAGGQGKGGDFSAFAAAVGDRLRAAVVYGEDAGLLADAFSGEAPLYRVDELSDAIAKGRELAAAGDTVLLAPACASFDQFENYQRRGDAFCDAVAGLRA